MFDTHCYKARRAALVQGLRERGQDRGLALFLGNGESAMNYADNGYPYRQDSSFLYFFGLAKPGLAATVDLGSGESVIYGDDLSMDDIVWTGPETKIAELAAAVGASAKPRSALQAEVAKALGGSGAAGKSLLWLPPYRDETRRELARLSGIAIEEVDAKASLPFIRAALALREIKEEREVAELEKAVAASVKMHQAALAGARPGMRESEIRALVTEVAIAEGGAAGGPGLSFPPIATTRGATLHNHHYEGILREGGLFLLDAGAETPSGYAGDLTTSFPIAKRFDEKQKAIYEIVLSMGKAAVREVGPGKPFAHAHETAAKAGFLGLAELGLVRGDADEAVAKGAHALFFPHGLGHQIGLDVHDMENYGEKWVGYDGAERSTQFGRKSLRLAKPLKAGMALTIEPGLYFIPELIAAWKAEGRFAEHIAYDRLEAWIGFGGMRNEEDWLVTEAGARRLGPAFDKSLAAIEAARA